MDYANPREGSLNFIGFGRQLKKKLKFLRKFLKFLNNHSMENDNFY